MSQETVDTYMMFVTSSILLGSGSLGYSGREGRFFRPPPQRNLLRREFPLSPAFWNMNSYKLHVLQCKSKAVLETLYITPESKFPFLWKRGRCFDFGRGHFQPAAIGKNQYLLLQSLLHTKSAHACSFFYHQILHKLLSAFQGAKLRHTSFITLAQTATSGGNYPASTISRWPANQANHKTITFIKTNAVLVSYVPSIMWKSLTTCTQTRQRFPCRSMYFAEFCAEFIWPLNSHEGPRQNFS